MISMPDFSRGPILTDGGIETSLIFQDGFDLPEFAAFDLLRTQEGRAGLNRYFRRYLDVAAEHRTGFILESPTWRASPDWGAVLGYSPEALEAANREAIQLLHELRDEYADRIDPLLVSGCIGPRGDGYDPGNIMSADEAADYHGFQARIFADAGVDLVTAITMTNIPEASGLARAAANAGLPCVISFTVETDGKLPTGETLEKAIAAVDALGEARPIYYMINCAHPTHFASVLAEGGEWVHRIRGLRTNASCLSHAELDEAEELDDGNPEELGQQNADLASALPSIRVFGGCCGTDERHIAAIASAAKTAEPA